MVVVTLNKKECEYIGVKELGDTTIGPDYGLVKYLKVCNFFGGRRELNYDRNGGITSVNPFYHDVSKYNNYNGNR